MPRGVYERKPRKTVVSLNLPALKRRLRKYGPRVAKFEGAGSDIAKVLRKQNLKTIFFAEFD